MKYIVSDGATLSFADGSKYALEKGIHDGKKFPDSVKKHWAFESYAKPIDEADLANESLTDDLTARVTQLEGDVTSLTEQLGTRDATIADREKTIKQLEGDVTSMKAELDAAKAAAPAGGTEADNADTAEGSKNAKKQ
ncbi:STY1053 family phage-associated protein [Pantoea endophytica]